MNQALTAPETPEKRHAGRPREFDRAEALMAAVRIFWRYGYEGASLTQLTEAMGISRPSLYAAFGDKATLFREAIAFYGNGRTELFNSALEKPTSREVIETLLRAGLQATDPENPAGCFLVQGAMSGGPECTGLKSEVAAIREEGIVQLRDRLARAQIEGDLPASASPEAMSQYIASLMNGISVQLAAGVSKAQIAEVVDLALSLWPGRESSPNAAAPHAGRYSSSVRRCSYAGS